MTEKTENQQVNGRPTTTVKAIRAEATRIFQRGAKKTLESEKCQLDASGPKLKMHDPLGVRIP